MTMTTEYEATPGTAAQRHSWLSRLYTGTGAFNIIGKRRLFFAITAAIMLASLLSIAVRGFTLGIEFEGGSEIQFPKVAGVSAEQVEAAYAKALGHDPVAVQTVGSGSSATFQIRSETLTSDQANLVQKSLFDAFHPKGSNGAESINTISTSDVSATWGGEITKKALLALGVFLVLVAAYIAVRYERYMAAAALAALAFDLTVTAGVYSLIGFEVSPATVIGMLTILGFSLYDSVVVFDKVEENTRGVLHLNRRTYAEQANLAVNQTLMRSINTTIIGALPVLGLMVIAVWLLGVGTLKDLALVQLVGLIVGSYSSIFFATPLLVTMKERWGPYAAHTRKVLARRERGVVDDDRPATGPARVRRQAPTTPRPGARPAGKRSRG